MSACVANARGAVDVSLLLLQPLDGGFLPPLKRGGAPLGSDHLGTPPCGIDEPRRQVLAHEVETPLGAAVGLQPSGSPAIRPGASGWSSALS